MCQMFITRLTLVYDSNINSKIPLLLTQCVLVNKLFLTKFTEILNIYQASGE